MAEQWMQELAEAEDAATQQAFQENAHVPFLNQSKDLQHQQH